jgi:hypothetical protein
MTQTELLVALAETFEAVVSEAEFRAGGSKGMQVTFTGEFCAAAQLPSCVRAFRRWALEIRDILAKSNEP